MDPVSAGASVVSGVMGLIGTNKTNKTNLKIAREANALQKEMYEQGLSQQDLWNQEAYAYQDKAWNREVEQEQNIFERNAAYNDPAAQMERYRAAGLNPGMMMYGQNAAVANGDVPSAMGAPGVGSVPGQPNVHTATMENEFAPVAQAIQSYFGSRSILAQARKTEAEANQIDMDNETRLVKNIQDLQEQRARIWTLYSEADERSVNKDLLKKQIDWLDSQIAFNEATWDSRMKQQSGEAYVLYKQGEDLEKQITGKEIENQFKAATIQAGLKLSAAQISGISQSIVESKARTKKEAAIEAETILRSYNLIPGSRPWKIGLRLISSQIYNNARNHLPFGIMVGNKVLEDFANGLGY